MHDLEKKIDREMRSGIYALLIMKAISDLGESYGYEIEKYISEKTGGKIELKDATVYSILRYLTKKKVLTAYWTEPGIGVPRKYYALTESGKQVLEHAIKNYRDFERCVDALLGGDKP